MLARWLRRPTGKNILAHFGCAGHSSQIALFCQFNFELLNLATLLKNGFAMTFDLLKRLVLGVGGKSLHSFQLALQSFESA